MQYFDKANIKVNNACIINVNFYTSHRYVYIMFFKI